MTKNFIARFAKEQKSFETGAKRLATKLAILFHANNSSAPNMPRSYHSEFSLFSPNGARKYLSNPERKRFHMTIVNLASRERLFCETLFWSGGRISEVLALVPDAIDLDNGSVSLLTLKRRKPGVIRQVPLPRSTIRDLSREFQIREAQLAPESANHHLWPWSRTTAWRLVKKVMAAAGIAGLPASPKGLRHTFGVSAFQRSVPPHLVQRWLGHASLRTTTIYGEVSGKEERQFASRMWRPKH
jgi:integrase/recombinase XerD